jgi:hypothetical protein
MRDCPTSQVDDKEQVDYDPKKYPTNAIDYDAPLERVRQMSIH